MKSLTKDELDRLLTVARKHSDRDALMILVTFNHGLRVSEVVGPTGLRAENVANGYIVCDRLKKSNPVHHPLLANEREGLERLAAQGGPLFPMTRRTFDRRMKEYGAEAGLPAFKCHVHVLKHTTGRLGYKGGLGLPEIQAYLGHKNGGNTLKYMQADEQEAAQAFAAAIGG
jgi:type 1 fimbriae regulatory protein FimE